MGHLERQYGSLQCLVSVPEAAPPSGGVPVLMFLHGWKEAAPLPIREALTRHGPLRPGSAAIATERFVVVAPQLPAPGGNVWPARADEVAAIARAVAREFSGDLGRMYLGGFSYGGNGVLALGRRQPEVWAALWPVDPPDAPPDAPAGPIARPLWVSSGPYSDKHAAAYLGQLGCLARPRDAVPAADRIYDHEVSKEHGPTATAAYKDGAIYEWLLARRLRAG